MDQILRESGNSTTRTGSSLDRRMQQHQQNPVPHSNAPTQPPPPPPPQQGHKCPRCDSTNTKFCYYNNYSLSQPRYFCKACRRYWTQGGTLRNVPVGGGCRKGSKRAKTSTVSAGGATSSATASSRPQPPPGTVAPPIIGSNSSYYPSSGAGEFFSSLAAIQSSMGQPQLELGGGGSSSMNIGFFQGLGVLPALSSQAQLFRGPPPSPSSSNHEWINTQGFLSNLNSTSDNPSNNMAAAPADSNSFWSPNRASGTTNSASAGDGDNAVQGASLNHNHWLGLPGYGPPQ